MKQGHLPYLSAFIQLLHKPRCGNKDKAKASTSSHAQKKRVKRFIVGSEGWKKRRITYK